MTRIWCRGRGLVPAIVAGMTGGADSVDDLDLLRHGALPALFGGIRAPSTLGSFLRSFTWGFGFPCHSLDRLESYVVVVNDGGHHPGSRLRRQLAARCPSCVNGRQATSLDHV